MDSAARRCDYGIGESERGGTERRRGKECGMEERQVYSELDGGVLRITVDNPAMKNGLDWRGTEQFTDCLRRAVDEPELRAIVITGNEEYFYTGGRVDPNAPGEQEKYAAALADFMDAWGKLRAPTVAAVNGHCMKLGMGLLAACDYAVAREGVRFCFPEVRMGGVPMMVLIDTVDAMPQKRALEALLTSWEFPAEDALAMGLVNRVVPAERFWDTVKEFTDKIRSTPKELVEMTRAAYYRMRAIGPRAERIAFAERSLREEVLPTMAKIKTEYNV